MMVRTWLRCTHCQRETPHDVRYSGEALLSATCVRCGLHIGLDTPPVTHYLSSVSGRMRSKPERIARELRHEPRRLLSLPGRIASKPSRVAHEVLDVMR